MLLFLEQAHSVGKQNNLIPRMKRQPPSSLDDGGLLFVGDNRLLVWDEDGEIVVGELDILWQTARYFIVQSHVVA